MTEDTKTLLWVFLNPVKGFGLVILFGVYYAWSSNRTLFAQWFRVVVHYWQWFIPWFGLAAVWIVAVKLVRRGKP